MLNKIVFYTSEKELEQLNRFRFYFVELIKYWRMHKTCKASNLIVDLEALLKTFDNIDFLKTLIEYYEQEKSKESRS